MQTRKFIRAIKRQGKNEKYLAAGLNGKRAVERRRRQIAKGQIRPENGLVA